ncbi:MAG: hypothetical protein ACP5H2_04320 [Solirubrobacteraceae bacterium]
MSLRPQSLKPFRRQRLRPLVYALTVAPALLIGVSASAHSTAHQVVNVPTSTVTVQASTLHAVPPSFLGLSMNVEEMEDFTNQPAFPNFVRLISPAGGGPTVIRVGGTFADAMYWNGEEEHVAAQYRAPANDAFYANEAFLQSLAAVLSQTGSDAILNVNAAAHDPQMALDYLEAAEQTLPSGSLIAAAIGNEPNLYPMGVDGITKSVGSWVTRFSAYRYDTLFSLYANLLSRHLPTLTLAGPELAEPDTSWLTSLLETDAGQVGLATEHYYAYSACAKTGSTSYPSLLKYFHITNIVQDTRTIEQAAATAHSFGQKFRLTELGSSTCLGVPSINDSFATSLWGLDVLYQLVADGVDGVNIHLRANEPNTAIQASPSGLTAHPLLYGIAAFASTLGAGAQLEQVSGTLPSNLAVWAVRRDSGWSLALINDTNQQQTVRVKMPASAPMTVKALTASSPWSLSASFGGQTIGSAGTWQGTAVSQQVTPVSGYYSFTVAPDSAEIASTGP